MSQTAIPLEFERYLQNQISVGKAPDMNEMIFAYIPGLDPSQPIDRSQGLPDVSLWVHQQNIDQLGKLGDNVLVYSVVVPASEEEFTFNAIYLRDKNVPNSCGIVVHKADETKENGMASTKSLAQQYDGAAQIAGITVDAATWQIDYQARLKGIEEDHRLACLDNYGHTAFVDGFDVIQQADPDKYKVTPGVVYVGGLRGVLSGEVLQTITTKPNGLYVDVVRQGSALSVWQNIVTITASETDLSDYVDSNGNQHYVAKLVSINADGSVVDRRAKGGLDQALNNLPIYPETLTSDNRVALTLIATTLTVSESNMIVLRGWNRINAADYSLEQRQFTIDLGRIYHLRFNVVSGFYLEDLSSDSYNPTSQPQTNSAFDSTLDNVLLAAIDNGVITAYRNVSELPIKIGRLETAAALRLNVPAQDVECMRLEMLNDYARGFNCNVRIDAVLGAVMNVAMGYGYLTAYCDSAKIVKQRMHFGTSAGAIGYSYDSNVPISCQMPFSRGAHIVSVYNHLESGQYSFNTDPAVNGHSGWQKSISTIDVERV